ncbi:LacI family DNA-binding transcriptional regulator [Neorhizobium sp. S3-V5DH]|uniref:LacI family DNA-binding transcriptional regulator n=1 Tax=Neorhizobium sp. S3-V5DH TaxID=2485166 RepID=UPI0010437849|nr:LacI family DNA-binding transcriptional regulator [Neorhizobium sp. S3-V5DH]TCV69357.1 regulatory LacI family protein [Neorhizobium sp. S3-V5DH]
MQRPTIRELAAAAGVSVATVNRVLADSSQVRPRMREQVRAAASKIGFQASALQTPPPTATAKCKLGFVLPQAERAFYRCFADALKAVSASHGNVEPLVRHIEDMSPPSIINTARSLASECNAIAVITTTHPLVGEALEQIRLEGVPVFALLSPLSESNHINYVGPDTGKSDGLRAGFLNTPARRRAKSASFMTTLAFVTMRWSRSGFDPTFASTGLI